ncbi:MAG: hypothetical protein ACRD3W_32650 [Terriglobales bacterium]
MRTTVDLPDDLYRRAKAAAAMRGLKLKDLVKEGLLRVLDSAEKPKSKKQVTAYDLMKDVIGKYSFGVGDLATNPKHMEGFGRD